MHTIAAFISAHIVLFVGLAVFAVLGTAVLFLLVLIGMGAEVRGNWDNQ